MQRSACADWGREWFQQIRDGSRSGLVISEPLQSRIDKKWVVVFARRLEGPDGRFAGAVYATVDVASFGRMLQGVVLGDEGAATVRSSSLALIARRTSRDENSAPVGSTKVSPELSRAMLERPSGGFFVSHTTIDGVERSNAYSRGQRYSLLVLVGLGTREFFAPWRVQAIVTVGILAAIALVLALASTMVWKAWLRQRSAQDALAQVAAEQQAMLDNEIVGMTKARRRVTIWKNRALDRMFGYEGDELLGTPTRLLYLDDRSHAALGAHAYDVVARGGTYRTQLPMRRKDGSAIWVDISGTRINEEESLWLMVDISAMKQHEEQVEHIAFHDALTGLPNRLRLHSRLTEAIDAARETGNEVVLAYLDLDGFKGVNDTHGHEAGDTLLREVAKRLTAEVRGKDTIARLGGDEFVIVMVDTQARPGAENVLDRILKRLGMPVEVLPGTWATIGASVGVAVYPTDSGDAKALLARADDAMFTAKRAGKDQIRFFRELTLAKVESSS